MIDFLIKLDIWLWRKATGGRYYPGELISSAAWRMRLEGRRRGHVGVALVDFLFLWRETDHCRKSFESQAHIYRKDTDA